MIATKIIFVLSLCSTFCWVVSGRCNVYSSQLAKFEEKLCNENLLPLESSDAMFLAGRSLFLKCQRVAEILCEKAKVLQQFEKALKARDSLCSMEQIFQSYNLQIERFEQQCLG